LISITSKAQTFVQISNTMTSNLSSKSARIVIVGAGVFGLSTAIHLAERGYTNVKVLDKQPYHDSQYSYNKGCDAASAGKFQRHSNAAVLTKSL
jgi:succinate dehydrogenase/fumarate reductase flavoprotein subunit